MVDKLNAMWAVIAIPEFDAAATAWIDALRRAHDPQQDRMPAHVTLASPQAVEDPDWFTGQIAAIAATTAPLAVCFDRLDRLEDPHHPKYRYLNVLLADEVSVAPLIALHRMLGDSDLAYRPHLVISRFGAVYSAKALERQVGGLGVPVRGRIGALELLRIENGAIRPEGRFALGG